MNTTTMAPLKLPGLDLTLLEAVQHNETQNPEYPIFCYDNEDGSIQSITWSEAGKAFTRASHFIMESLGSGANVPSPRIVGILANLDSITFFTVIIGIMRAGCVPFLISTRNSPEAIAHLMTSVGSKVLLISDDSVVDELAGAAIRLFEASSNSNEADEPTKIQIILVPSFEHLYHDRKEAISRKGDTPTSLNSDASPEKWDRLCVVAHSSGTTSLPKPVRLTHRMVQQHASMNRHDEDNYIGSTLAAHGVPMFHLMGFTIIGWSTMLGLTLALFRPKKPPVVPAPGLVLQSAIAAKSQLMFCAPAFLEAWSSDKANVESLRIFRSIMYGGGPMRGDIGDFLVQQGVKMSPILGLTETGCITTMFPKHIGPEISPSWLEADPNLDVVFIPEDEDKLKGVYRIALKENNLRKPAYFNTKVDGVPAYDTEDLVIFHPDHPKYFKLVGRADDQITHSTGEKTNPGPIGTLEFENSKMEMLLSKSPYIAEALVFGRARLQTGVLIKPAPGHEFDIKNNKQFDMYLDLIWDAVMEANVSSPHHSRIFKEMILVMDSAKPFEYTPKGTLRRELTLRKYASDIDQLYDITEGPGSSEIGQPASLNFVDVADFVRAVVRKVLDRDIKFEDDIFHAGADSLCALSIRLSIMRGLRGLVGRVKADTLPRDLVYLYPTISALAAYISNPFLTLPTISQDSDASKVLKDDLQWENILKTNVNETVVKITPGSGEPPLILIHGGGGGIDNFRSFMNAKSAVWALQMTDDLPLDSTETVCAFYHKKIKEQQPCGPYRLAAYSGSCLWILELVRLFESDGDDVSQLDILDHCPSVMFPNFDPNVVQVNNAEWMAVFLRQTVLDVANLLLPTIMDRPRFLSNTVLVRRLEDIKAALNSDDVPPHLQRFVKFLQAMQETSIRFLMKKEFLVKDANGVDSWSSELFRKFTAQIRAPITLYVATYGIGAMMPPGTDFEKMRDLGASMVFDKYSVVSIPGDHVAFLDEDELHTLLLG